MLPTQLNAVYSEIKTAASNQNNIPASVISFIRKLTRWSYNHSTQTDQRADAQPSTDTEALNVGTRHTKLLMMQSALQALYVVAIAYEARNTKGLSPACISSRCSLKFACEVTVLINGG